MRPSHNTYNSLETTAYRAWKTSGTDQRRVVYTNHAPVYRETLAQHFTASFSRELFDTYDVRDRTRTPPLSCSPLRILRIKDS